MRVRVGGAEAAGGQPVPASPLRLRTMGMLARAMAYACPKCGGSVQRGSSAAAQHAAGLVGALIYAAFAGFNCLKCGKLARTDFPDEDRATMMRNSVLLGVGGIVLLVVCIGVLIAVNS